VTSWSGAALARFADFAAIREYFSPTMKIEIENREATAGNLKSDFFARQRAGPINARSPPLAEEPAHSTLPLICAAALGDLSAVSRAQLVERFFNKTKQCRRVATRAANLRPNYLAFIKLASTRMWLRVN
jgi:hypothetical protein